MEKKTDEEQFDNMLETIFKDIEEQEFNDQKKEILKIKANVEEKMKKAKLKDDRDQAIQNVKKEILFLGETPLSEFEVNNNDEYIAALNKQLDNIKSSYEEK